MSKDLTSLLRDWPHEPGQLNVRLIEGDDGEPRLQMRLDLGILQMELTGRPDGQRPNGAESLLEYYETVLDEASAVEEEADEEFFLSEDDCRALRDEAAQYYHRYISLLVLGEYEGVVRDTSRNLRVLDLCKQYAESEEDRAVLEQFRPYILMMRARAIASQCIADNEGKAALLALDEGIERVEQVYRDAGRADEFDASHEAQLLRGMRAELAKKLPASQRTELRKRLEEALARENYELAAILRDELKMLKDETAGG